jgi:hypothetical protein
MKLLFLLLFGLGDIHNMQFLLNYADTSYKVESVLCQYSYISDEYVEDEWKTPMKFIEDGGGDCEDFALMVKRLLEDKGYELRVYILSTSEDVEPPHCIIAYKKGKDIGYFSNRKRFPLKDFDIDKVCKQYRYKTWMLFEE